MSAQQNPSDVGNVLILIDEAFIAGRKLHDADAEQQRALIAELAAALEIGVPLMQRWADEGYYGDVPNSRAWLTNAKAVLARAALARVKGETQ